MKKFVINLPRRIDKLLAFKKNIQSKLEDGIEYVEAIDGRFLDYDQNLMTRINKCNVSDDSKVRKKGVIGCCLSHLKVYDFIEDDDQMYLIFEDDAILVSDFDVEAFLDCLKFPPDAGIVWLNFDSDYDDDSIQEIDNIQNTTEAYIVKGKVAKELYNYNFKNLGAIDRHIFLYFENQRKYKMYATKQVFKQNHYKTDIQIRDYPDISEKRCAYVINLQRRSDRLHKFYERFQKYHDDSRTALYLKTAVDGSKLDENIRYNILFKNKRTRLSNGEIGCLLSHYEIWKEISQKNLAFAIIYEDDVNFHTNFKKISNDVFLDIPHDFQILYLGGRNTCVYPKYVDPITNNISIHHPTILSGIDSDRTTHAYVISQSCCNILIEMIESQEEFNVPLDHMMLHYLLSLKIPVLNSNPLICYSDNANGDITRR